MLPSRCTAKGRLIAFICYFYYSQRPHKALAFSSRRFHCDSSLHNDRRPSVLLAASSGIVVNTNKKLKSNLTPDGENAKIMKGEKSSTRNSPKKSRAKQKTKKSSSTTTSGAKQKNKTISTSTESSSKRSDVMKNKSVKSNRQSKEHKTTGLKKNDENIDQKKWILLVEDEDSLRKAIGKYVAKEGRYLVTGVVDARSAMLVCHGIVRPNFNGKIDPAIFFQISENSSMENSSDTTHHSRSPDCIILDIRLPGEMDGLELLKTIRSDKILSSLPVVLLTAKGRVEDRVAGYNAGADAYLSKPFDPAELLSIVDSLLRRNYPSKGTVNSNIMDASSGNDGVVTTTVDLMNELKEIESLLRKLGFDKKRKSTDESVHTKKDEDDLEGLISIDSLRQELLEIKASIKDNADQIDTTIENATSQQTFNFTKIEGEFFLATIFYQVFDLCSLYLHLSCVAMLTKKHHKQAVLPLMKLLPHHH